MELLIVAAIIGLIVAIAIPNLLNALQKSKQVRTVSDMRTLSNGLGIYQQDYAQYPTAASLGEEARLPLRKRQSDDAAVLEAGVEGALSVEGNVLRPDSHAFEEPGPLSEGIVEGVGSGELRGLRGIPGHRLDGHGPEGEVGHRGQHEDDPDLDRPGQERTIPRSPSASPRGSSCWPRGCGPGSRIRRR
mgnify:CR=1 FL=1